MMKKVLVAVLVLVILGFVMRLLWQLPKKETGEGKIKIVTSFYPLYFFAGVVGGEKAEVKSIVPAGVEPHDYEPTAGDVAEVIDGDLLILNGGGFEGWAEKIKTEIQDSGVVVLEVGEGLTEGNDPHIWLSLIKAREIVAKIVSSLMTLDPENTEYYIENGKSLDAKLEELHKQFAQKLRSCAKKEFVTSHDAFGYLAKEFGLTQIAISGLSPDEEPSISELAKVANVAKRSAVKYIFFETLVSPRLAETIATEVGARTLVLNPIEGVEEEKQQQGINYFTIMEDNLTNLQTALECQ